MDGIPDGIIDGSTDGITDGIPDGSTYGIMDGNIDGSTDGITDGIPDGSIDWFHGSTISFNDNTILSLFFTTVRNLSGLSNFMP